MASHESCGFGAFLTISITYIQTFVMLHVVLSSRLS